jgi:hypothetical protein
MHYLQRLSKNETFFQGRRIAAIELRQCSGSPEAAARVLLPPAAQQGDVVCLFKHIGNRCWRVPFLLRPVQDATFSEPERTILPNEGNDAFDFKHFIFVGECFVEGYMWGISEDTSGILREPIIFILH